MGTSWPISIFDPTIKKDTPKTLLSKCSSEEHLSQSTATADQSLCVRKLNPEPMFYQIYSTDMSQKIQLHICHFQKTINLTIDILSLGHTHHEIKGQW